MTADSKIIKLLKEQAFLDGLPAAYFPMIADCAELAEFRKGDYLMRQHHPAQCFYLLLSGYVSLNAHMAAQGVMQIETVMAPSALGWSWLVAPYRWHFDAQAMSDIKAVLVHTPCILGKVEQDREFGCEIYRRFIEVVVDRLHGAQLQMMDIYAKPEQGVL